MGGGNRIVAVGVDIFVGTRGGSFFGCIPGTWIHRKTLLAVLSSGCIRPAYAAGQLEAVPTAARNPILKCRIASRGGKRFLLASIAARPLHSPRFSLPSPSLTPFHR